MVREDWRAAARYQMRRQRWSEAGSYRRLAAILVFAQATLVSFGLVALVRELPSNPQGDVGLAGVLVAVATIVVIALNFLTTSAVLSGSFRGRTFATLVSVANFLFWFPQVVLWFPLTAWHLLAISAFAIATCVVVWLRDPTAGGAGIARPLRPLT
jgi:hypothetical protein